MNEQQQWYGATPIVQPVRRTGRRVVAGIASLAIAGALSLGGYAAAQAIDSSSTPPATVDLIDPGAPGPGWQLPWGGRVPGNESSDAAKTEATAKQQTGVVTIDTEVGYGQGRAAGSGIVLTDDGYVLTNHHVIENATAVEVTVESTGQSYQAEVVGSVAEHEVALLKLTDASDLTQAAIDDDGDPKVGDEVTTVGNSNGGGALLAANGTVTGLNETITAGGEGGSETLNGLIQADVDVVSGDSGGAMLDDEGEVVGMTTAASTRSPDITGYAIDIDDALKIVQQIRSGDESGSVTIGAPAFLGVQVDGSGSATIAGTVEDSPAAAAGLEAGDTITRIDDTAVSSADELVSTLGKHNPGDEVTVTWTDAAGESHSASVTLAAGPAS
jgi:S1-C subfamily serine protease